MSRLFSFLLLIVVLLGGCQQNQTSNTSHPAKPFSLEQVKLQYANIQLSVADISEQNYNNSNALSVTLSVPLNPSKNFQSFFKVSDKNGQPVAGAWILSQSGLEVYFPSIEPSSTYTVDVLKGLTAATGSVLNDTVTQKVDTRQLNPQVSFVSKGSILPAKLAQGLPVVTTNIDAIDVEFQRVKPNQIQHFLQKWAYQANTSQTQPHYYLQQYTPFIDLVYTGRFDLHPPKNTRYTTHLDLNSIAALKQPGIYLATLKAAGSYAENIQTTYFVVSDLGIHSRVFADKINVQISSLSNGKAVEGVTLNLLNEKEEEIATLVTDKDGQATFAQHPEKSWVLLAKKANHLSVLSLNTPALDLSEFTIAGRQYHPLEIFTYSPRDLYRPGETVKFSAILRDADAHPSVAPPLNAVIKRPDGQSVKLFTWHPEKSGYYQTEFILPGNAMTGDWTLELETAGKNYHDYKFKVEAFLPERMELLLGKQPPKPLWTNSEDSLTIPISGQYLYGAPAEGNRLSSKVLLKPLRHPLKTFDQYFFGDEDEKPPVAFFDVEDLTLDAQGLANLEIESHWKNVQSSPFTIKVISSLFETGGRPVTRSLEYTLWPYQQVIGIRPQIDINNIPYGADVNFDLIKATAKGVLGNGDLIATLIKERNDYYWIYSSDQGWHSEHTEKNIKVFEKRVSIEGNKPATLTVPVEWGSYLLRVKDAKTGQTSTLRFNAGGWYGYGDNQNNQSARPDRVVLELDKKAYTEGETVKLKVTPPYTGNGFVVVENSEQQLWFKRIELPANGKIVEIPIDASWNRHDLYISTVVFRAGDAKEKITPNRAVGLVHLPLDRQQRHLQVSITSAKNAIRPETTLTSTIKIANAKAGQKHYVTLAAVDVGVLNITDFVTPDPFLWFFEPRRYAVDQRDIYNQIIELTEGGLTKARFGGDADKHAGGARPDSSVEIVSLFSGLVETDAQGIAKIPLKIPDFNGRLRLMAVAFNDDQFGAAQTEITVAAPIIAETSLPRFLAADDSSVLTLDLRNQSGATQTLELEMTATAPVHLSNGVQTLTLADKEKQVLHLPLIAGLDFGSSEIDLHLTNAADAKEKIKLHRHWRLGVRPAYPALTKVQRKIIQPSETVNLTSNLQDLLVSSINGQLNISPQPPLNLKQQLEFLLHYPYGCLEQTLSSTYPWVDLNAENLHEFGLDTLKINGEPIALKNRSNYIDQGISRLMGMQLSNGGFGLWSNDSDEEFWLTAYAGDFLLDAKNTGINVPQELLDKTLARLLDYVNQRENQYNSYSEYPTHSGFAYKTYAGYVLSRVNRAPLGSLRTLYEQHKQESLSGLPLTHLGLALINQGDKTLGQQALKEALNKIRDDKFYLGDYGSRLRDLTQMTYLLALHPLAPPAAKNLIFQLADELALRDYLSTQERNALFRTGALLKAQSRQTWQGQLTLDKTPMILSQTAPYSLNFSGERVPAELAMASASTIPLYLEYSIQAYPTKAPIVQLDGFQLERHYYNLQGKEIKLDRVRSGDTVLVDLMVSANKQMRDALVVDLLPAGFELENQDLKNSIKIEAFKIGEQTIEALQSEAVPMHQEYLDDRFVAAMNLSGRQHAFYLIRAVTKGMYTNPPPYLEDMYRPYLRAVGADMGQVEVY